MIAPLVEPNRTAELKCLFGSAPGRMSVARGEVQQVFQPIDLGGNEYLNDEAGFYVTDWSHHLDTPTSIKLMAGLTPGRTITGTAAYNAADKGAVSTAMLMMRRPMKYGLVEMSAKMPGALGAFPAFWTWPVAAGMWPPEVDFVEIACNLNPDGPSYPHFGYMPGDPGHVAPSSPYFDMLTVLDANQSWKAPVDLSLDFHLYWCEVLPYRVGGQVLERWRRGVDGTCVSDMVYPWRTLYAQPAPDGHIIIDLAYGGSWAGRSGIDASKFPVYLEIEHFHAYGRGENG